MLSVGSQADQKATAGLLGPALFSWGPCPEASKAGWWVQTSCPGLWVSEPGAEGGCFWLSCPKVI